MQFIKTQYKMNPFKHQFRSILVLAIVIFSFNSCVHDDDYNAPTTGECTDMEANISIANLKAMYTGSPLRIEEDLIVEGYVVSSDASGNIYKTLYIQDAPSNPTQGLSISVDATDTYTLYPFGSKVYIKLKDLWLGEYGGVVQVGDVGLDTESGEYEFGRIPFVKIDTHLILGCEIATITPLPITMSQMNANIVGALVSIEDVQVKSEYICESFALSEQTSNRVVEDCSGNTTILRNSGYASFQSLPMPSGKGTLIGVLSAYNSDYQIYLNDHTGMAAMTGPRCDGESINCSAPENINASIQEIKNQYDSGLTEITSEMNFDAVVTANDATGNLYKYVYLEDETGGIRLRLNKPDLYLSPKYYVGEKLVIKAKNLYIDEVNGELHLGGLYNNNLGNIEEEDIYKHVFDTQENINVTSTILDIASLSTADIGKLVTFENLEFTDADMEQAYAPGSGSTNRNLQDCNGNTIIVRTSSYADFASNTTPFGNGTITGILSIYNGTYQILLRNAGVDVSMDNDRCDGSVAPVNLFHDDFESGLSQWTATSISGSQVWYIDDFGGNNFAKMSGYAGGSNANEDWLISHAISLTGHANYNLNLDSDQNYNGPALEAFISTDFSGDVNSATWVPLPIPLDPNGGWGFYNSGDYSLNDYADQTVYIAFKYTSTDSSSATWELDNIRVTGEE